MTSRRNTRATRVATGALLALSATLSTATCRGEVAAWGAPALDTWSYVNGFGTGSRLLAPSFGGLGYDEQTQAFFPGAANGPTRLGSMMAAFETADQVTPLLDPARYAIESVTVTVRMQSGSTGVLEYADQPLTVAQLLESAQGGEPLGQPPIELFGVGFRDGYEGFALGADQTGDRFAEDSTVFGASDGGYVVYPVVGDGGGGLEDVSNNFSGGFSATAPGGVTDPFDATPWALGAVEGLAAGDSVANDTTFSFDLDLSLPGVDDYLRQSLSDGAVGFFVSSMHSTEEFGTSGAYPQWYAKEAAGLYTGAEPATLSIEYTILPLAGDYDSDGEVTGLDLAAWQAAYGSTVGTAGEGADGNSDGVVDAADYTVWRNAYAEPSPGAIAAPEPSSGVFALVGVATVAFCVGVPLFTTPRRPDR